MACASMYLRGCNRTRLPEFKNPYRYGLAVKYVHTYIHTADVVQYESHADAGGSPPWTKTGLLADRKTTRPV